MRSRKPLPLKLAPRAKQDFVDILRYTGETWGLAEWRDALMLLAPVA